MSADGWDPHVDIHSWRKKVPPFIFLVIIHALSCADVVVCLLRCDIVVGGVGLTFVQCILPSPLFVPSLLFDHFFLFCLVFLCLKLSH